MVRNQVKNSLDTAHEIHEEDRQRRPGLDMQEWGDEMQYELNMSRRQIAQLESSIAESAQTFAMLQEGNKKRFRDSMTRRMNYRQLARILEAWFCLVHRCKYD